METYFSFAEQIEHEDNEEVINFYEEMVIQILTGKADPRFLND